MSGTNYQRDGSGYEDEWPVHQSELESDILQFNNISRNSLNINNSSTLSHQIPSRTSSSKTNLLKKIGLWKFFEADDSSVTTSFLENDYVKVVFHVHLPPKLENISRDFTLVDKATPCVIGNIDELGNWEKELVPLKQPYYKPLRGLYGDKNSTYWVSEPVMIPISKFNEGEIRYKYAVQVVEKIDKKSIKAEEKKIKEAEKKAEKDRKEAEKKAEKERKEEEKRSKKAEKERKDAEKKAGKYKKIDDIIQDNENNRDNDGSPVREEDVSDEKPGDTKNDDDDKDEDVVKKDKKDDDDKDDNSDDNKDDNQEDNKEDNKDDTKDDNRDDNKDDKKDYDDSKRSEETEIFWFHEIIHDALDYRTLNVKGESTNQFDIVSQINIDNHSYYKRVYDYEFFKIIWKSLTPENAKIKLKEYLDILERFPDETLSAVDVSFIEDALKSTSDKEKRLFLSIVLGYYIITRSNTFGNYNLLGKKFPSQNVFECIEKFRPEDWLPNTTEILLTTLRASIVRDVQYDDHFWVKAMFTFAHSLDPEYSFLDC
ncbi:550_t:CDS:2, partial [Racocetra persica]